MRLLGRSHRSDLSRIRPSSFQPQRRYLLGASMRPTRSATPPLARRWFRLACRRPLASAVAGRMIGGRGRGVLACLAPLDSRVERDGRPASRHCGLAAPSSLAAKVVNGPAWYPGARVRPLGLMTINAAARSLRSAARDERRQRLPPPCTDLDGRASHVRGRLPQRGGIRPTLALGVGWCEGSGGPSLANARLVSHPDVRLDVSADSVFEPNGHERPGHHVVAVLGEGHARPGLPLRDRAADVEGPRGEAEDLRS